MQESIKQVVAAITGKTASPHDNGWPLLDCGSPLLSNLYMSRFAVGWKKLGHEKRLKAYIIINYADDLVISCRARAEEALVPMQSMMSRQQQRQRGKDHHAAVRALAFKWIRIVFRCWQDGAAYDETRYLATLAKHASLLIPVPAATQRACEIYCGF